MMTNLFFSNYLRDIENDDFAKQQVQEIASKFLDYKSVFFSGREIKVTSQDFYEIFDQYQKHKGMSEKFAKNIYEYAMEIVCNRLIESECIMPKLRFHDLFENSIGFYKNTHDSITSFEYQYIPARLTSQNALVPLKNAKVPEQRKFLVDFLQDSWREVNHDMPKFFQTKTIDGLVTIKLRKKPNGAMRVKFTLNTQREQPTRVLLSTAEAIQSVPLRGVWRGFDIKVPPKPILIKTEFNNGESAELDFNSFINVAPFIPSRFFLDFCPSMIGMEYLKYFSEKIKSKKNIPSMPCAEELHKKMDLRLADFENEAKYKLSEDDKLYVAKFKQRLIDNKKKCYPYFDTLNLTYIFVFVTSYLFFKYGCVGDEAHPQGKIGKEVILNAKDSFEDCKKAASALSLRKLLSIPDCCFGGGQSIKCASCCQAHLALARDNSPNTQSFNDCVEKKIIDYILYLPVAIDLSVKDFNRLAEYPIALLGVLTKNYVFHDVDFMSPIDFLHHDASHRYYNEQAISYLHFPTTEKASNLDTPKKMVILHRDVVSSVIRSAYLSFEQFEFKKKEQRDFFEILFFQLTHEVFLLDETLSDILMFVRRGLQMGGKFYGLEKTPQAEALARLWDESESVTPIFDKFYKEIQNACVEKRLFDPNKAWH